MMFDSDANVGKNIREIRKSKGISQAQLAKQCDFSNTTLSAYENSKKIPNAYTLSKIARQLNVSMDRLYLGDENERFIVSVYSQHLEKHLTLNKCSLKIY